MPAAAGEWTILEYERTRGDVPVRTFIDSLTHRNANDAAALILKLRARGNMLRGRDSEIVTGQRNLFELRGHQVRIFYMFLPGRVAVLLDGIIKKQDKIPRADLDRVLGYQRDVERRGPRAP